jgi:hypothetical protein
MEKAETFEAEKWFGKTEEAGCYRVSHAQEYGRRLIKEKGDKKRNTTEFWFVFKVCEGRFILYI